MFLMVRQAGKFLHPFAYVTKLLRGSDDMQLGRQQQAVGGVYVTVSYEHHSSEPSEAWGNFAVCICLSREYDVPTSRYYCWQVHQAQRRPHNPLLV